MESEMWTHSCIIFVAFSPWSEKITISTVGWRPVGKLRNMLLPQMNADSHKMFYFPKFMLTGYFSDHGFTLKKKQQYNGIESSKD